MKSSAILCCIVLFLTVCQEQKPFIQGAWKMVHNEIRTPDTTFVVDVSQYKNSEIKIYTDSYFAFGRQRADSSVMAGGGKYTLVGDSTTEYIKFHTNKAAVNQTYSYRVWLQNDTLCQQGKFQNVELLEKYIRLE